ncbi:deoxyribonuclease-1-like [Anguilla anguilla]|uniref:deoxyribonuclease-1-like n=1 Tax=Anguilla anguilla TaxID=7936 RepID=UPI0015A9F04A|nr:deoxyribonuclease-1-like [Anguilla anguilla]XP_035239452.1 deoxyribonuclease-1-like [Anguilla anguilla]
MKIASFNVQRFGLSKISDPNVLSTLIKIVSRYDIIVILEVVDVSGASVERFLTELNRVNTQHHYTLRISTRLGRTRYKEQFLFLYRDDSVCLVGSYQYEDTQAGDEDVFAREPYILRFRSMATVLKDLVLIPVHTKPSDSVRELDELYDVFLAVKRKWKTDNIMILGDFNADGGYVSSRSMQAIRIRSDRNFHWLIRDDVDTTANTGNEHTYDRIVVYGDDMLDAIVPNSAQPFNFQKAFNLTEEMALDVSDHYPVEVELKSLPQEGRKRGSEQQHSGGDSHTEELYQEVLELKKKNQLLKQEKLKLQIQMLHMQMAQEKK